MLRSLGPAGLPSCDRDHVREPCSGPQVPLQLFVSDEKAKAVTVRRKRTGLPRPCRAGGPQQGRRRQEGVRSREDVRPPSRAARPGQAGPGLVWQLPALLPAAPLDWMGRGGGLAAALTQPEGILPCSVLGLPSVFNDDSEHSPTASYGNSSEPGVAGVGGQNEPEERAECVSAGRRQGPERASLEGPGPPWTLGTQGGDGN